MESTALESCKPTQVADFSLEPGKILIQFYEQQNSDGSNF